MINHVFATMNAVLDEIMREYPTADSSRRIELEEQLSALKSMSDTFVEEWLLFEEKMGKWLGSLSESETNADAESGDSSVHYAEASDDYSKGQGYYKLFMFQEAIHHFEQLIAQYPDFLVGRMYLAMSYLRTGDYAEAYRHFQFLLPLTDNDKIKAISYNAMGCIQVRNDNMEKAYELFKKAYQSDPSFMEPLVNMGACIQKNGVLQASPDFIRET